MTETPSNQNKPEIVAIFNRNTDNATLFIQRAVNKQLQEIQLPATDPLPKFESTVLLTPRVKEGKTIFDVTKLKQKENNTPSNS